MSVFFFRIIKGHSLFLDFHEQRLRNVDVAHIVGHTFILSLLAPGNARQECTSTCATLSAAVASLGGRVAALRLNKIWRILGFK